MTWMTIDRFAVRQAICHNGQARDSWIRRALIDQFPPTGGGACPQIGTKKKPGPLHGFKKDMWSALAIALTAEQKFEQGGTGDGP
jgi:hypothetical protein